MSESRSKDVKSKIIELHTKGMQPMDIFRKLKKLDINSKLVYRTIKRFKDFNQVKIRKSPGRPRTVRTPEAIKRTRERFRRNPRRSARKQAQELNMSQRTFRRLLKDDLGFKAFKKHKIHALSEAQNVKRVQRSKTILGWHAGDEFIFTDEKLFSASLQQISEETLHVSRSQSAIRIMVWGAICNRGKLPLVFIDKGVKINQNYYIEEVLEKNLKPEAEKLFGDDYYCFQQDGAPAHIGKPFQNLV